MKKYRRSNLDGSFTLSGTASNVFDNLLPGTYAFVAIDSFNCADTIIQVIPVLIALSSPDRVSLQKNDLPQAEGRLPDFQLQPNPAHQSVRLIFSDGQIPADGQLDITDAAGRVLRQIPLGEVATSGGLLSLENLPTGVATVVLRADGQAPVSRRLVIF